MPDMVLIGKELRPLKVGLVPCNGEGLCGGTVTRYACRKVLDELRPQNTVTICLPLFVAGGEGERNFAQVFPAITVDGCEKRCSSIATEKLSGKPALSLVVPEILEKHGRKLTGNRKKPSLDDQESVEIVASEIAKQIDQVMKRGL
jgi:uncharacterized metal-binding protein